MEAGMTLIKWLSSSPVYYQYVGRRRKQHYMSNHIIKAGNLKKSFNGEFVVNGIDLQVPFGGCFGLLGPNGAGKTTTLRMILGQSPLTEGSLEVMGLDVPTHARRIRRDIGVVPQLDNLDPDFTVAENLKVYAGFFNLKGPELNTTDPRNY